MNNINRVEIAGNLTRDPEMRVTNSGTEVLTFGVAVGEDRKNPATGQYEEHANFVDCCVFGKYAQIMAPLMYKGQKVCVAGRLRYSSWEKDGQRRSKLEVVAETIELMRAPNSAQTGSQGFQAAAPQPTAQPVVSNDLYADDEIPF